MKDYWQEATDKNVNCFPNCSTFQLDPQSQLYFCINCGCLERDIIAYEKLQEKNHN